MNNWERETTYNTRPTDLDVQNILAGIPEDKQRTLLAFVRFIRNRHKNKAAHTFEIKLQSHSISRSRSVLIDELSYIGISEMDIEKLLWVLRKIYKTVPEPPSSPGVINIYYGLPDPKIVTSPDNKKYVVGLDVDVVSQIDRLLSHKFGSPETIILKEINQPLTSIVSEKQKPRLVTKGKQGYLKFYVEGRLIRIGNLNTRKYRLLVSLFDPIGTAKSVEEVFSAISLPKDDLDGNLKEEYLANPRKREIINFTMKDLQKINRLKGRISLIYFYDKTKVALRLG